MNQNRKPSSLDVNMGSAGSHDHHSNVANKGSSSGDNYSYSTNPYSSILASKGSGSQSDISMSTFKLNSSTSTSSLKKKKH